MDSGVCYDAVFVLEPVCQHAFGDVGAVKRCIYSTLLNVIINLGQKAREFRLNSLQSTLRCSDMSPAAISLWNAVLNVFI